MGLLYLYLNFLEPSGPRQFCNGVCYTFTLITWTLLDHAKSVMGLLNLYLKFLELSGTRQLSNGTAILLH